jgi:acyl carrier protein
MRSSSKLRARQARVAHLSHSPGAPLPVRRCHVVADGRRRRPCRAAETGFLGSGWLARQSVATANWIAETDEHPFSSYWTARPSRLRNTVERKRKRAQLDIRILDRFDAQSWSDYEAVYRASWKPAEGSPAFLRAFAEQSGRWGSLRLGLGYVGGRPVAAQLWTVDRDIATIHKLAHDEAAKAESPGTVLTAAMFEHVIDRDRPMIVDFGTGDDAYKRLDGLEARPVQARLLQSAHAGWDCGGRTGGSPALVRACETTRRPPMVQAYDDQEEVDKTLRAVLVDVLGLAPERVASLTEASPLFGALPEFDSMAVAGLLTELEERLGILIEDHDVDADMLETYGSLLTFTRAKALR